MKEKKRFGISKKILIFVAFACTFICIASCISGFMQYSNTIKKLYNENGYVIGDIILNNIDTDKVSEYTNTWKKDDYYFEMKEYLDDLLISSNCKYIYIAIPDSDGNITYVYDSSGMDLGEKDPVTKYLDEALEIYNTGIRNTDNYFVRKSPKYGYITASILPVKNSVGEVKALLFVDIAMELIKSTLFSYLLKALLISAGLTFIFIQAIWLYMRRSVIKPIKTIESSLNKFADKRDILTDELLEIKTNDEVQDLSGTIYRMEQAIINYVDNITEITAEKERIGAELNVATQIQANMLPSIFPPFPDRKEFDIYASMTPAKEVGGDFYDFFMIDNNHVGIVMADVSGKGVPAALFMAISKTLIKNRAMMGGTPAEILESINNQLCKNNKSQMFVTCWLGILNINTGIITAANAGHEYPSVKHADGKYELIKDKHGFVLGGMEGVKYKDYTIELAKGDALYIYTDGVAEATNADEELFGTDRMLEALNRNPDGDCRTILENVQASIDAFVLDAPQFDDITMLCLEYYGEGEQDLNTELKVAAEISNIESVTSFINEYLEACDCSIKVITQIDIAIDEILSNIVFYAFTEEKGEVTVKVYRENNPDRVAISFIDNGKAYNPLEKEDPDVSLKAEERSIGGLGIFIVKKSMDDVTYEYVDGMNILTIKKNI